MGPALAIKDLSKTYDSGLAALSNVNLSIRRGEIFALLGANGAGKTTLINIVCGIVKPTSGAVLVSGYDNQTAYRRARREIGLVPQELTTEAFETVIATVRFSRRLFGKPANEKHIEGILRDVSLWDKRNSTIMSLSGGMKRRVLIAKALSHEPNILFLDEPTAGVDVSLRKEMWTMVSRLRSRGVTIILTTHYIEEAEEMADRIGIIRSGKILLVENKSDLMKKLGQKQLKLTLAGASKDWTEIPPQLSSWSLELRDEDESKVLVYTFDKNRPDISVPDFLSEATAAGVDFSDIQTDQSSLEEIFVGLVNGEATGSASLAKTATDGPNVKESSGV